MDFSSFWQFEFVDLATYRVQNLKRPKEFCLQLSIAFGFDIFTVQPNFFTRTVTSRFSSFIVGLFLQFLGMLQLLSIYSHEIPMFFGQLISCFRLGAKVDILFIGNTWVVPAVELKKHVPRTNVFCVILSKFRHRQKPCPVVLFVINEDSKVSFYCAILLLSLALGLRVKDGRESMFDAQEVAQEGPELKYKY